RIMRHYDVVHTHNSSPQLFVAIASLFCNVRMFTTEHTTSNRKRNWKWYAPIESWMYGRYEHVICISKIAEEKLREYMGGDWLKPGSA
ncbi:glycosyltransferase, partial [Pseudomonas frederiksbergensis]|nr:glycosyltransferase [Pseudomonas frederiksbergensis]